MDSHHDVRVHVEHFPYAGVYDAYVFCVLYLFCDSCDVFCVPF